MPIRQVTVTTTADLADEAYNIFYFSDQDILSTVASALEDFYSAYAPRLRTDATASLQPEIRVLDTVTGQLQGFENFETADTWQVTGTGTGSLPDQACVLVQWRTNEFQNGRELRGRTFLPFPANNACVSGNLGSTTRDLVQDAAVALANTTDANLRVWSRTYGLDRPVDSATCWNEFAHQSRRRG